MIQHDSHVYKVCHVNIFILNHRLDLIQQMLSEFHNLLVSMFHCESHSFINGEL